MKISLILIIRNLFRAKSKGKFIGVQTFICSGSYTPIQGVTQFGPKMVAVGIGGAGGGNIK